MAVVGGVAGISGRVGGRQELKGLPTKPGAQTQFGW